MDYTCGRASVIRFHIDLSVHNIHLAITNLISPGHALTFSSTFSAKAEKQLTFLRGKREQNCGPYSFIWFVGIVAALFSCIIFLFVF